MKCVTCCAPLLALVLACANETPVAEIKGDCHDTFTAQICSYASVQGQNVLEAGVVVPLAAIEQAPVPTGQPEMSWPPRAEAVLNTPESARGKTGLNEFTFYWEPNGHPPGAYLTPHFDFHFYVVPAAERAAIDCKDRTKPATLAAGYSLTDAPVPPEMAKMIGTDTLIGICVPGMGMHSLLTAELSASTIFRGTMVIGYYHAKPIFIEPMISRAMLLEKKSFDLPIPVIPGLTGPHPTTFHAEYDAQKQQYRFAFAGFAAS